MDDQETFNLLIDSTLIINKYGSDQVGYGSETRKKKFSKVTLISTENEILNVTENHSLKKEVIFGVEKIKRGRGRPRKNQEPINNIINGNEKRVIIETLEHDVKGIIPVLESCGIPENKKKIIIGDAGYIVNDETKQILAKKNVTMITPYRKNQKKVNTLAEKKKLKKRNVIERKINLMKRNNRVHVRKDRYMINYMGFFYLGLICTF